VHGLELGGLVVRDTAILFARDDKPPARVQFSVPATVKRFLVTGLPGLRYVVMQERRGDAIDVVMMNPGFGDASGVQSF
jgi:hypothetical protein